MKNKFWVSAILGLAAFPLGARADITFRCSAGADLQANLRLAENGRKGQVELDSWQAYPPAGLVYAGLRQAAGAGAGTLTLLSDADRNTGARLSLRVPAAFSTEDRFIAPGDLVQAGQRTVLTFQCERF